MSGYENNQNKTEYIPISELAREFGYEIDHISRLCRQQRIKAIREPNGRWHATRESLTAYQAITKQVKQQVASKNLGPRPKSYLAPSSSLRISDKMPGRVNFGAVFKTASKFALLGIFVFFASSSIFAFAKNDNFKTSLKKIGQELAEIIIPDFNLIQDQKQIIFTFGNEKFLGFKNLTDELDTALYNFQSFSQNYQANLFDSYLSPVFNPIGSFLGRLFGKKQSTDTAELDKQIEELKNQLSDAHFKISNNERILEEKIKEGLLVQENQVIRETEKEKTTITERRIVTVPSNVETRLISVERLSQDNEKKFKAIELTLASIDNRFSYTPTIIIPSGGGGHQGVTISNPNTTDSETVKVSHLLDVTGDGEIDGKLTIGKNLTVDTNTFFVNSENNRVGIGTTGLETALEVVGTASISGNLLVSGSGDNEFSGNVSISQNLFVLGNVGVGTTTPQTKFEVQGTASASYLLTGNTLQVGGFSSAAYSRFGTNTTSYSRLGDANDLLITDDLEVDGTTWFDGTVNFSGISSSSLFYAQPGTAASPSFSFAIDQDTGMFRRAINALGFSTLGAERLTILSDGNVGIGTTTTSSLLTVQGRAEFQGTASASYLLTGNTLQVGGFGSAAYSRFGTGTTGHSNYISTTNDVLVSGDLETRGTASFGGVASVSGNFFTYGTNTFSGTGSSSFAGSLLISKGFNALAIVGTGLTINGNAGITGNTTIGDASGDTVTSNADAWTFANDTNLTLSGGVNGLSFDTNTLSIDATNNRVGILTTGPSTTFEVQGTASASYLLTGNTLQVGGFASVAYNRFGTSTTDHANYITTTNDLLISGDLEVNATAAFDSHVAIGDATDGTDLVAINSQVRSHIIPFTNTFDVGSTANRWRKVWTDSLDVTNLTAASSSISGTVADAFTVNSDNTTSDTEDSSTTFERGSPTTNAVFKWDSTNNRFDFNFPAFLQTADPSETSANFTKLTVKGTTDQGSNDYFEIQNKDGSRLLLVEQGGRLIASSSFQAGGNSVASAAYSRFGTDTTGYSSDLDASNDLLISGALEINGNAFLDGKASISGNFQTAGRFIFGDSGDTGEINTSDWDISGTGNLSGIGTIAADGAYTQTGTGANTFSGSTTLSSTGLALLTSAGRAEFQGTASASYLLTGNTLQVGGFGSAAYSRFGTSTTGHSNYISTTNDVLVSGDLETRGTASFGGVASVSGNFFTYGTNTFSGTGSSSFAGSLSVAKGFLAGANNALMVNANATANTLNVVGGNVGVGTTSPLAPLHVLGQCVTGDTRLRRRKKKKNGKYEDDEVAIKNIKSGDKILSLNETTGKLEYRKVKGLMDMGVKPIFKLTTASGKTIRTTGNHPYLVQINNVNKKAPIVSTTKNVLNTIGAAYSTVVRACQPAISIIFENILSRVNVDNQKPAFATGLWKTVEGRGFAPLGSWLASPNRYCTPPTANLFYQEKIISTKVKPGEWKWLKVIELKEGMEIAIIAGGGRDAVWDEIAKIERLPNEQVYDIEVEGTHNFVGNDIVAHNTFLATSSGNVGIGTTTPSSLLTVQGRAEFQGTASASYLLTGNTLQVGGVASAAYSRFGTATTGHSNYISTTNDLLISGDLEVRGSISANIASTSQLFTMNNTASASHFFKSNGSGGTNQSQFSIGVGNGTERLDIFNNANSPFVTIASSGNVGIGTTGPGKKLEVAGETRLKYDSVTPSTILSHEDLSNNVLWAMKRGGTGSNSLIIRSYNEIGFAPNNADSILVNIQANGNVGVGTTTPSSLLTVQGRGEFQGTASASYLLTGNTLQVGGFGSAAYSRFGTNTTNYSRVADANDLLITDDLEVDGTAYFDGTVNFSGISSSSLFYAQPGTAASPSFAFAIDQDTGMFRSAINQLGFSTLGAERMTILSDGNVGIGTTGPSYPLHILNSQSNILRVQNSGVDSNPNIGIQNDVQAYALQTVGARSDNFEIYDLTSTATRLAITTSGNVGIGTTAPGAKLQVDVASPNVGLRVLSTSAAGRSIDLIPNWGSDDGSALIDEPGGSLNFRVVNTDHRFRFFVSGTEIVRFAGSGNVGIGTTTPSSLLTVQGRGEFQGTASASYLLTGNTLQVGGFASVAYNRFGTSTTGHSNYISTTNDVLVSGDLEVDGSISAQFASVSQVFIANNTASASAFFRGNGSGGTNQSNFSIGVGNGTERLNIFNADNSPIVTVASSGNVGIGTTGPGRILHLSTTNPGVSLLRIEATGNDIAGIELFSGHGNWSVRNSGSVADAMEFRDDSAATIRMLIDSAGNVGIGTTGPTSLLEVIGTVGIGFARNARNYVDIGGEGGTAFTSASTLTTPTNFVSIRPGSVAPTSGTGDITVLTVAGASLNPTGASTLGTTAYFTASSEGGAGSFTNMATVYIASAPTGGTSGNGALIVASGNVGIGTTTPSSLLTVQGRAEFQGTASASYLLTGNTLQVGGFASAAYSRFGTSTTGHSNYISTTNDVLVSGDLEVDGSISAQFASVSQVFIANNTASASAFFRGNGSGGTNQSNFSIGVGNGTERLDIFNNANSPFVTIASSGNVGIGTTGPTSKLQIVGGNCADDAGGGGCTADFAEYYPSTEDVEKGDLVAVDDTSTTYAVTKASASRQKNLIGIVSTAPAAIADGGSLQLMANDYILNPRRPAVTLAGRVPVKVSDENGTIKAGDRLTVSKTKPGYAMKQTEAGMSIGIALETFNPTIDDSQSTIATGKILTFVNLSFWAPSIEQFTINNLQLTTASDSQGISLTPENNYFNSLFSLIVSKFSELFEIVFEKGLLKVAQIFTNKVTTKELCVGSVCVTEAEFMGVFGSGISAGSSDGSSDESDTQDPVEEPTTLTPESEQAEETASASGETVIESTPEPTPEPSVEPTLESTPEPSPEETIQE